MTKQQRFALQLILVLTGVTIAAWLLSKVLVWGFAQLGMSGVAAHLATAGVFGGLAFAALRTPALNNAE